MIIPDMKRTAQMIIGRMHPDGSESSYEGPMEEPLNEKEAGLHASAQSIIDAFHSKSPQALSNGLRDFLSQHEAYGANSGDTEADED